MARRIAYDAKVDRPGVCNAAETLLVSAEVAAEFLPGVLADLHGAGVELVGDGRARLRRGRRRSARPPTPTGIPSTTA